MGASANFPGQYATKRCRSNRINWGMTPFLVQNPEVFAPGDCIFVPCIRKAVHVFLCAIYKRRERR